MVAKAPTDGRRATAVEPSLAPAGWVKDATWFRGPSPASWSRASSAFVALLPFREALAGLPGVLLLATPVSFLAPGLLLVRWVFGEYFSGVALVPAAFVTSVGLFALSAVPMLVAEITLDGYLWVSGTIVAVCLPAAAVHGLPAPRGRRRSSSLSTDRGGIMWAPFRRARLR